MLDKKKNLQDYLDKARHADPVTKPEEVQTLIDQQNFSGAPAPKPRFRLPKGLTMNVIGSTMIGAVMIGVTAMYISNASHGSYASHFATDENGTINGQSPVAGSIAMQPHNVAQQAVPNSTPTIPNQGMLTDSTRATVDTGAIQKHIGYRMEHVQEIEIDSTVSGDADTNGSHHLERRMVRATVRKSGKDSTQNINIELTNDISGQPNAPGQGGLKKKVIVHMITDYHADTVETNPQIRWDDTTQYFGVDSGALSALLPHVTSDQHDCIVTLAKEYRKMWVDDSLFRVAHEGWGRFDNPKIKRIMGSYTLEMSDNGHPISTTILDFTKPMDMVDGIAEQTSTAGKAVTGARMLTLDGEHLTKLGIYPNAHGAWLNAKAFPWKTPDYSWSNPYLNYFGPEGTFDGHGSRCKIHSLSIGAVAPVAVTDERGALRQLIYDPGALDSAANGQRRHLPFGENDWRRMAMDLNKKAELEVLSKMSSLIPVLVHVGGTYSAHDAQFHYWRPDVIFWYEPTKEFLALLPDADRQHLQNELNGVQCMLTKMSEGSVSSDCQSAIDKAQQGEAPVTWMSGDSSTKRKGGWIVTQNKATGETKNTYVYLDLFRSATGAILSSMVYPNPAVDKIAIQFKLSEPRNVSFTLHDLQGKLIRSIATPQNATAGEHSVDALLQNVTPGMYLLAISTEKGEQAVQRVIVVDRK